MQMHFIDPYSLFGIDHPRQVDAELLRKLRKRTIADFELLNGAEMKWQGLVVNRSQALQLLDQLELSSHVRSYWKIHESPALLQYLALQKLSAPLKRELKALAADEVCWPILESYLLSALAESLRRATLAGDTLEFCAHEALVQLLPPVEGEAIWGPTVQFFMASELAAKEMIEQEFSVEELMAFANAAICTILNKLPQYYQFLRDDYAATVALLALQYHVNSKDSKRALEAIVHLEKISTHVLTEGHLRLKIDVLRTLRQMDASQEGLDSLMDDLRNISASNTHGQGAPNRSGWSAFGTVAVLVGLVVLLRMFGGKMGGSHDFKLPNIPTLPYLSYDPNTITSINNLQNRFANQAERIYDSLWAAGSRTYTIGATPRRPEDGERMYGAVSQLTSMPDDTCKIWVDNRASDDIVLFIAGVGDGNLRTAVYLHHGKGPTEVTFSGGILSFSVYQGKDWVDPLMRYNSETLAGFSRDVKIVGDHATPKHAAQFVSSRQLIRRFPTTGTDSAERLLRYDGKHFQWHRK